MPWLWNLGRNCPILRGLIPMSWLTPLRAALAFALPCMLSMLSMLSAVVSAMAER